MMKATISRFLVVTTFALALPFLAPSSRAADSKSLLDLMEAFDTAYKGFRREADPEKALPLVREAQNASLQSIPLLPPMLEKMPDGPAKAKAAATYRNMMAEVFLTLTRIELAYIAGDMEVVTKHVSEIRDARRAGHDQFMEE